MARLCRPPPRSARRMARSAAPPAAPIVHELAHLLLLRRVQAVVEVGRRRRYLRALGAQRAPVFASTSACARARSNSRARPPAPAARRAGRWSCPSAPGAVRAACRQSAETLPSARRRARASLPTRSTMPGLERGGVFLAHPASCRRRGGACEQAAMPPSRTPAPKRPMRVRWIQAFMRVLPCVGVGTRARCNPLMPIVPTPARPRVSARYRRVSFCRAASRRGARGTAGAAGPTAPGRGASSGSRRSRPAARATASCPRRRGSRRAAPAWSRR